MIRVPVIRRSNTGRALLAGYALFVILYLGAAAVRLAPRTTLLPTPLDAAIPFVPWTVWIYLTQFALLVLAIVAARDDEDRTRAYYAMVVATVLAALVFVLMPTQVERVQVSYEGLTGLAWRSLHATDTPANCFPSLHVALASISGAVFWRLGWRAAALLWPAAIAISALTTRQHVAWDIPAGLALGALAWLLTPKLIHHERAHALPHASRP